MHLISPHQYTGEGFLFVAIQPVAVNIKSMNRYLIGLVFFTLGWFVGGSIEKYHRIEDTYGELTTIDLDVADGAYESAWRDALASRLNGETEVRLPHGRADVVTRSQAIEVDRASKWKEGLGQALYYGEATGKKPTVAIFGELDEKIVWILLEEGVDVILME